MAHAPRLICIAFTALVLITLSAAAFGGVVVWIDQSNGNLYFRERPGADTPLRAVEALVAGPTEEELAMGLGTAIPAGTSLLSFQAIAGGAIIDLSREASVGLDEHGLEMIFKQFAYTLHQFGLDADVRVMAEGALLSDYLAPAPPAKYPAPVGPPPRPIVAGVGLSGKRITLSPGHGYYYTGSYWTTQRGVSCGYEQEDFRDLKLMSYLKTYLENDGAYVQPVREHNMSRGNGPSGHPWWQESAYVYLRDAGYSCSVYGSSSGVCSYTGANHLNDDIRARPLASDLDSRGNTDIYVSMHTNAFQGDCTGTCPSGTETYYDASSEHAAWGAASQSLGNAINPNIVSAINSAMPEISPDWGCHGACVKDSNGAYGEIRIPDRPATLTELGFHDTCDRDAPLMNDDFFRSVAMWGAYKGICSYFGNTPTYAMYSSQYVSDNIPAAMNANEVRSVSITFRNKGVIWSEARSFRLGAVGDSDPFAGTRQYLGSTVVQNNDTFTFTFNFVAPATPGTYTTDWRMLRDGFAWFGDTLTKQVQVQSGGSDTEPPSVPGNLQAESTDYNAVSLSWTASTDNVGVQLYQIRRNGGVIDTVNHPTVTYNDTSGLSGGTSYTYEVRAKDYAGNYSGWSNSSTTKTWTIVAQDNFANLNQWTPAQVADGTIRGVSLDTGVGSTLAGGSGPPSARADIGSAGTNGSYSYLGFPASFAVGYIQCSFLDTSSSNNSRQGISFRKYLNDDPSQPRLVYFLGLDSTIGFGGYDCEVFSASAGWTKHTDTGGARSAAWHKFKVSLDGANTRFYVDGALKDTMAEPVEGPEGCNRFYIGYNFNVNQTGWYDDFLGVFPSPPQPTMNAPSGIGQNQITWNYTEGIRNWEQGFYIRDLGGALKATGARNSTSTTESGIPANTLCTRTVSAFNGTLESIVSNSASATTLSVPPTAGNIQASPPIETWTNGGFTFTSSAGFGPGGVQYYRYEFDMVATHTWNGSEPQWNSGTLQTSADTTGNWYLHLKGFNSADVANGALDLGPFYYDASPPVVSAVTDDGALTASASELHFTLSGSDIGSGIAGYEYAVGTTSGGTEVRTWTAMGQSTDLTATGLPLSEGPNYFVSARATDNVALTGGATSSDGIQVAPLAASIGAAKLLAQYAPCRLLSKPVVAVLGGRVYIEESNRSAALAIVPDTGSAAVGSLIDIAGWLSPSGVERSIAGDYLKVVGSGSVPAPVFMLTSGAGGSALGPSPGATGGIGLNNVGLLVAVFGVVSDANPGAGAFAVNDGSGPLAVEAPGLVIPSNGESIRAVGIVRLDGALAAYLAPRSQEDIPAP